MRKLTLPFLLLLAPTLLAAEPEAKPAVGQFIGKVTTGVMAIGAETTGTTLTCADGTFELDLHGDEALIAAADKLNGKDALVTGTLEIKEGVEVRVRKIIKVKTLVAPPAPCKK